MSDQIDSEQVVIPFDWQEFKQAIDQMMEERRRTPEQAREEFRQAITTGPSSDLDLELERFGRTEHIDPDGRIGHIELSMQHDPSDFSAPDVFMEFIRAQIDCLDDLRDLLDRMRHDARIKGDPAAAGVRAAKWAKAFMEQRTLDVEGKKEQRREERCRAWRYP